MHTKNQDPEKDSEGLRNSKAPATALTGIAKLKHAFGKSRALNTFADSTLSFQIHQRGDMASRYTKDYLTHNDEASTRNVQMRTDTGLIRKLLRYFLHSSLTPSSRHDRFRKKTEVKEQELDNWHGTFKLMQGF